MSGIPSEHVLHRYRATESVNSLILRRETPGTAGQSAGLERAVGVSDAARGDHAARRHSGKGLVPGWLRQGGADKKLDREGTGEGMYSYEERKKAVEAYMKNGCNARQMVKELGYPTRPTLVNWYWEEKRTGRHKEKFERAREYSEGQRREAVEYYFAHGMSLMKTIRELALPIKRDALRNWIKEFEPERELNCKRPMPLVQCTQEQKEEAVAAILCTRGKTEQEIAEESGVSRPAVTSGGDTSLPGRGTWRCLGQTRKGKPLRRRTRNW